MDEKHRRNLQETAPLCSFPDTEASWIPTPKPSRLLSPRRRPSTTLSSMQSFTPNTGEGSRSPRRWPRLRKQDAGNLLIPNRNTLAEKVPCLHFLSQASRRECVSVSQSESSLRDSMLSRRSSGCKPGFHRVTSMSTTDTVSPCPDVTVDPIGPLGPSVFSLGVFWFLGSCRTSFISPDDEVDLRLQHIWSDVELDHISHPRQAGHSLGALKDRESVARLPEEKGS